MKDSKLNTLQFAQSLFGLDADTSIAFEFDMEFGQTNERWWSCQREHFTMWAMSQNTHGVKGYTHKPNTNSAKMYNNIRRPELLLWLVEALHISLKLKPELKIFKDFVEELPQLETDAIKQCLIIRNKYSYDLIEQTLENWVKSGDTELVSKNYYNNRYCNEHLNMTPYFTSRDAETSDEPLEENVIEPITNFTSTLKLAIINMPVFEIYNLIDSLDKCNLFVKHGIRNYYKPELKDDVKCYIWAN